MYAKMIVAVFAVILAAASAGMVGGFMEADINDPNVQNALQYAVAQYNRQTNDAYVRQVSQVIKAQQQLVSGMKYIFTVKMVRTNCRKGGVETQCDLLANSQPTKCKIVVWSQPWLNSIKVLEHTCS